MTNAQKQLDDVARIMRYEQGEMNNDEIVEFFQHMIDTGLCWQLQGNYGRTAHHLLNAGVCFPKGHDAND